MAPAKMFDKDQWDGSDFFRIWPIGEPFVTERVRLALQRQALTGIRFSGLGEADVELEAFQGENPHRVGLRWVIDEPGASEMGKPLGIY